MFVFWVNYSFETFPFWGQEKLKTFKCKLKKSLDANNVNLNDVASLLFRNFQRFHNTTTCKPSRCPNLSKKIPPHLLSFFSLSAPTSVNPLMTVRWRARWTKSSIRAVLLPRECPSPAAGPMMLMQVQPLYPAALWLFTCSAWPPLICWKKKKIILSCTDQSLHSQSRRHTFLKR